MKLWDLVGTLVTAKTITTSDCFFSLELIIFLAPNIVKLIPNVIMCNQTQEVTVYGQLFKKGKGVTCGITNLGLHQTLTSSSLNDMISPWKVPPNYPLLKKFSNQNFTNTPEIGTSTSSCQGYQ